MYGMRPLTVVLGDECLDPYLLSHKLGCHMAGFEHVFHTDKPTDDVLGGKKQTWLTKREDRTGTISTSEAEIPESRTKLRSDRQFSQLQEADEISSGSSGGSRAVGDDEDLANEPARTDDCLDGEGDTRLTIRYYHLAYKLVILMHC